MEERRRSPRLLFQGLVHCEQVNLEDLSNVEIVGKTIDISEVGILLETQTYFPFRSEIKFGIAFGEKIISAAGRVVRLADESDGDIRMGIEFTEISDEDKEVIRKYREEKGEK